MIKLTKMSFSVSAKMSQQKDARVTLQMVGRIDDVGWLPHLRTSLIILHPKLKPEKTTNQEIGVKHFAMINTALEH